LEEPTIGIFHMPTIAAAGSAFLLAVLWFDLMFDVQSRRPTSGLLPTEVLASISAYYRRVTIEAYPMNRLVSLVMLVTVGAIVGEIVQRVRPWWIGWVSLALVGSGVVVTLGRTIPNARRLGSAQDMPGVQSALARAICRDHLFSFARTTVVLGLQLIAR
jgi:hypothetical protein